MPGISKTKEGMTNKQKRPPFFLLKNEKGKIMPGMLIKNKQGQVVPVTGPKLVQHYQNYIKDMKKMSEKDE